MQPMSVWTSQSAEILGRNIRGAPPISRYPMTSIRGMYRGTNEPEGTSWPKFTRVLHNFTKSFRTGKNPEDGFMDYEDEKS
ncbi:hypothetical protein M413DRAFT_317364 [Hebeloma cylindrosporum]|uniref:Uncharacterized protein n=1 Tax=Hebeloma cylindrosporum TaxID=76867 RepID=A0A0C2Y9M7_HEBCY|nr:hypothetical protein M413DRAFT_317364 [Hebeloma cylindrosporum h7]